LREGCLTTEQRIDGKVCELLESYQPEMISAAQLTSLDEIIAEHERRVSKL